MIFDQKKHCLIFTTSFLFLINANLSAQKNNDDFIFGKYFECISDSNRLYIANITFNSDSTFLYESVSSLKDKATGTFRIIENLIILQYSDGCGEKKYKITYSDYEPKPLPIEMLGISTTTAGRICTLVKFKNRLYFNRNNKPINETNAFFLVSNPQSCNN